MIKTNVVLALLGLPMLLAGQPLIDPFGAIIRSDTSRKEIYLCFSGHDYVDGFDHVLDVLTTHHIQASFFLTGDFVRTNKNLVQKINQRGHYIGAHSDKHLLYCDWEQRDSLLHSESDIRNDIQQNLLVLNDLGIQPNYFMPPYEWYNARVVRIAQELKQITINFTPGTRSHADYTTPSMSFYISSEEILSSIYNYLSNRNMNGFYLLIHPGTSPDRKDKFYYKLDELITSLKSQGYAFSKF